MEKLEKRLRKLFRQVGGRRKRVTEDAEPETVATVEPERSKKGFFSRKRSKSASKLSKKDASLPSLLANDSHHPALIIDSEKEINTEVIVVKTQPIETPLNAAVSTLSQLATVNLMKMGADVQLRPNDVSRKPREDTWHGEPVSREMPPEWTEVPYIDTETVAQFQVPDLPSDYGTESSYASSSMTLLSRKPTKPAEECGESGYLSTVSLSPRENNQKHAEFADEGGESGYLSTLSLSPKKNNSQTAEKCEASGYLSTLSLLPTENHAKHEEFRESGYLSTSSLSPREYTSDEAPSPRRRSVRSLKAKYKQQSESGVSCKERTLQRAATTDNLDTRNVVERFLKENIYKTKFVTSVFEAQNGGLEDVVDDVIDEMTRWMKGQKMLAVACEVHFSVPLVKRSRKSEYQLKTSLLKLLLENNQRILNLQCRGDRAPLELVESRTQENIFTNKDYDAIQGVYQRSYHRLLRYAHEDTPQWHQPYWQLTAGTQIKPDPVKFLYGSDPECLRNTTLVAVNVIGLSITRKTAKSDPALS